MVFFYRNFVRKVFISNKVFDFDVLHFSSGWCRTTKT